MLAVAGTHSYIMLCITAARYWALWRLSDDSSVFWETI